MQIYHVAIITLASLILSGCGTKTVTDPLAKVGGYRLIYKQQKGKTADSHKIERVLREQINAKDSGDVLVQLLDGERCEILLPGASEQRVAEVKKIIASGNVLQFRIVALEGQDDKLIAACADGQDQEAAAWIDYDPVKITNFSSKAALRKTADGKSMVLVLKDQQPVDASHVKYASPGRDESQRPCIHCKFTAEGAARMQKLTSSNRQRQLAIIIDGSLINAPTIQSPFGSDCQLTGNFTVDEIVSLITPIRQAQMFADLEPTPVSEEKVAAEGDK